MISRNLAFFCGAILLMLMAPVDALAQAGCTLSAPHETVRTGPSATFGSLPLTATGSCPSTPSNLSTSSTAPWLQASGSISPFGADLSFSTESNFTGAPRTAVIVVNGQALITVTQGTASCVSVTPATHTFPVTGGTVTFQVETTTPDCIWTVTGFPFAPPPALPLRPGWVVPSGPISNIGTGSFGVTASSNAFNVTGRSAILTVGGSTTVTISQPAPTCQFTFSPASISVPANGGSATVNLTGIGTDCSYTASTATESNWVTVTAGASGSAPATISVTAGPNTSTGARTGQVIAVNGVLSILQAGSPIALDTGRTFNGITFGAARQPNGTVRVTSSEPVGVTNGVEPNASWSATASQPWIVVTPASGATPATMHVSIDPVVLAAQSPGTLSGFVDIFSSTTPQTPQRLFVGLNYYNGGPGSQEPTWVFGAVPLGFVDTPTEGATGLSGAVPITGWAVDRVGITTVRIYRAAVAGEPQGLVFVGDAVRVFGARPDLMMAYGGGFAEPRLGGWGLMVLSNMLPGGGNGTFTFFAYVQDFDGNNTLLGTRTVTFDNAAATKPFGAIDTPTQGGVASGTAFVNFGWALTPLPKTIPTDGSTITVLVDGAPTGTVNYNHPRADIQSAFPGLNNTNGAIGFKIIDTSLLTNGLHTISWTVVDDDGAIEGIGSRFFTVSNGSGALTKAQESATSNQMKSNAESIARAPRDDAPVLARRGWDLDAPWRWFAVGAAGRAVIRGEEIDRFEFWLGAHAGQTYTGYLRVGDTLAPLPVGSRLDPATGWFTWAPGVGFVGTYDLVFLRSSGTHATARHAVRVIIAPKGSGHVGAQLEIDTPRTDEVVTQPFLFGGWAADLDATLGTGIDTVHVWAYPTTGGAPIFIGTPTLGGARRDVAAVHGEQFSDSAFNLHVQGLAPGMYDLAAFPWSNVTNAFAPPKSIRVTVR